ncbi:HD domain-containing protein [Natrinema sp. HArc-T2]|uniref:HD domain-containing protein n=1 Tax=Natrinema sp. HArc-T2 TaxID=3242701 RepID=UPI00359DCFA2
MLEAVRTRARPYFEDAPPAHDWYHVQRVETLAETLVKRHSEPVDERVVRLAVVLHDIGRTREDRGEIDGHARWGARKAGTILRDCGAGADDLDALGAVGIARAFAHGGAIGSPIYDPACPVSEDDTDGGATQYNHVSKKLLALPARLHTDVGHDLAVDRVAFVQDFLKQFEREVDGDR